MPAVVRDYTLTKSAELLGLSRFALPDLLKAWKIPSRKIGTSIVLDRAGLETLAEKLGVTLPAES